MSTTGYTSGDPTKVSADAVGQPGGPAGPLDEDGLIPAEQIPGGGGGPGGAVASVNGQSGVVVLDAGDVGADAVGTAANEITDHEGDDDPHEDRAHASGLVSALEVALRADLLAKTGGTVTGPITLQALLTLARLTMTSPNDLTTLITLVAPSAASTDPDDSANLLEVLQDSQPTWWLNENGNPRARAAKTTEAAERLYGLSGQAADIFQVLRTRADPTVLVAAKPNGNLEILGNLVAANHANSAWTLLTSNDPDYTAVDGDHAEWQPAVRLVGAAGETVEMRGRFTVATTVLNDVMTILPSQFRPSKTVRVSFANGQSTAIHGLINPSGQVTIGRATAATFLSLDGINFSRI
uniref:hypothetical protein n=1 Tax=Herbidospora sakaeratensis TaxID=564415 RepID=UPI00078354CF|nr:hypothetical protein [Herbidospora sakaeratensis]